MTDDDLLDELERRGVEQRERLAAMLEGEDDG